MKNRISWIIAVIAGYVISGLPAWLMGNAEYGLGMHLLVFCLVTFGVGLLLHYAAIWRNNRNAARDRKAESENTIFTDGHMANEHDGGLGECQEAPCIATEFDDDLIDDDHQVQDNTKQIESVEAERPLLMQERARSSLKRKRRISS